MITAVWIALFVLAAVLEAIAHRNAGVVSLGAILGLVWRRPLGRAVLLACWAFAGVHFLCRYTLPA
jgi:hypothetical protein